MQALRGSEVDQRSLSIAAEIVALPVGFIADFRVAFAEAVQVFNAANHMLFDASAAQCGT